LIVFKENIKKLNLMLNYILQVINVNYMIAFRIITVLIVKEIYVFFVSKKMKWEFIKIIIYKI